MKAWFLLPLIILILGCESKTTVKKSQIELKPRHASDDIKFDFLIAKGSFPKKGFTRFNIPFLLVNMSLDTLYLASTTCYGPSYFLETDTTQLQFFTLTECQSSSLKVESIPPNDTLHFISCVYNKNSVDSIKIGFRFVDKHWINWQNSPFLGIATNGLIIWRKINI